MITCNFEKRGSKGLCEFLYESIKNQILDGTLKKGEKLPSRRSLAQHLGLSVITVQNAYSLLICEGYIYSVGRKGFFVEEMTDYKQTKTKTTLTPEKQYTNKSIKNIKDNLKPDEQEIFADFSSSSANIEKFPFSLWSRFLRKILNSGEATLLKKSGVQGVLELRQAICTHLYEFRNMQIEPDQIIICAGTESVFSILVQLLGRKKTYAVENPGYKKILSVINLNGAECIPVDVDEKGLNPELLEKSGASFAHISPTHHFPTGIVMPIGRRIELLNWALQDSERYIIEDDYDSEFRFTGKPIQSLYSCNKNSSVIYVNTFSKTLAPSFRISYLILPFKLVEVFNKKFKSYSCPVSVFEQLALAEFMEKGFYLKHIIRMKNFYRGLRNDFIYALQHSPLSLNFKICEEDSGLHFLLKLNINISEEELKIGLKKQGLNIPLMSDFFYKKDEKSEKCLLINYSGIEKNKIPEIIRRMEKAILI